MSLQGVSLSSQGFCPGVFVWVLPGVFLSVPLLSEYIRHNIKQNITFNFRFYIVTIIGPYAKDGPSYVTYRTNGRPI